MTLRFENLPPICVFFTRSRRIMDHVGFRTGQENVIEKINHVLEEYLVNFRYKNGKSTRITDPIQEMALESVSEIKLDGVPELFQKAREHLDKRPEPNIANAIKDPAIALEQACKLITGVNAQGIEKPLAILSRQIQLNGAIESAIKNLYGYSCQIRGWKHGTLEPYEPSLNEAILRSLSLPRLHGSFIRRLAVIVYGDGVLI